MAETDCGITHYTIQEAIRHARVLLGAAPTQDSEEWLDSEPVWGSLNVINVNHVIGFQITSRRRWRLDYSRKREFT